MVVEEDEESERADTRARAAAGSCKAYFCEPLWDFESNMVGGGQGRVFMDVRRHVERRDRRGFLLVAWSCSLWLGLVLPPFRSFFCLVLVARFSFGLYFVRYFLSFFLFFRVSGGLPSADTIFLYQAQTMKVNFLFRK